MDYDNISGIINVYVIYMIDGVIFKTLDKINQDIT